MATIVAAPRPAAPRARATRPARSNRPIGPRPISILGFDLPMLPLKLFPSFLIQQICNAIEACHDFMVANGIQIATRYGEFSAVYDVFAPTQPYPRGCLRKFYDDRELRLALGWEIERLQQVKETYLDSIPLAERRETALLAAERIAQVYRELRRRHKAARARQIMQEELAAMQQQAAALAWCTRLVREGQALRARGETDMSDLLANRISPPMSIMVYLGEEME